LQIEHQLVAFFPQHADGLAHLLVGFDLGDCQLAYDIGAAIDGA
jgi:hypothetical protein